METRKIKIKEGLYIGGDRFFLIAGPCVIESEDLVFNSAEFLKDITKRLGITLIFKSSYDKANRSSVKSFRGPGIEKGLRILWDLKNKFNLPVLSDVHSLDEIGVVSEVLDVLQIPAFLSRQTDLIIRASLTGKPVNIKKGQFLAPWDVKGIIEKFISTGNNDLILTERGTSFGYNNLIVDMRSIPIMRSFGYPVVFDATHSVQLPGAMGSSSGGERKFAPYLLRAAVATGVDGIFMEVHPDPDKALCDGPNMIRLDDLEGLLSLVLRIRKAIEGAEGSAPDSFI